MLIFERKLGETITIQTPQGIVRINLKEIEGNRAKLGVEAPKSVSIMRQELLKSKR